VIGVKLDVQVSCGAFAARHAPKAISHKDFESQSGPHVPTVCFSANNPPRDFIYLCVILNVVRIFSVCPLDKRS